MSKIVFLFLFAITAIASNLIEADKGQFYTTNLLTNNAGFERGIAGWSVSVAGTLVRTTDAGSYASGLVGGKWTS
jgi:hypothetical protein